jgi:hypothetical protein
MHTHHFIRLNSKKCQESLRISSSPIRANRPIKANRPSKSGDQLLLAKMSRTPRPKTPRLVCSKMRKTKLINHRSTTLKASSKMVISPTKCNKHTPRRISTPKTLAILRLITKRIISLCKMEFKHLILLTCQQTRGILDIFLRLSNKAQTCNPRTQIFTPVQNSLDMHQPIQFTRLPNLRCSTPICQTQLTFTTPNRYGSPRHLKKYQIKFLANSYLKVSLKD